jgi:uncharacterized SAM-binding protein YcdF (DUF218 family)
MRRTAARAAAGVLAAAAGLAVGAAAGASVLALLVRRAERAASAPLTAAADLLARGPAGQPPADAVVVFGAAVHPDGPSAELRARLDHALALWRLGVAPLILVSGGLDGGLDEVDTMTAYLVGLGVPGDAVAPARPGDTTRQSLRTLRGLGDRRYVAVSSPYHALRIRAEARRQGLRLTVSAPTSTPETRDAALYRVRFASELFALVWYALPPRLTAHVPTGPGTLRHVAPRVLAGRDHPFALVTRRRARPS